MSYGEPGMLVTDDDLKDKEVALDLNTATREQFMERAIVGKIARQYLVDHFSKYAAPQSIARFMARYEIFKMQIGVCGSIIDCGTGEGDSAMTWLQLAKLLEPRAYWQRWVYCFDTFDGFPGIHEKDGKGEMKKPGEMFFGQRGEELHACMVMHDGHDIAYGHHDGPAFKPDLQRIVPFLPAGIVKGDFMDTGPKFAKEASHLVVSLMSLDFDLYEPTKLALELFLPRMPKGAVILFDELNHHQWPGETTAALEAVGLRNLRLQRFPFEPTMSYAVLE